MENTNLPENFDTSQFYLDGSPSRMEHGFFDRFQQQNFKLDEITMGIFYLSQKKDDLIVNILRPIYFFHAEQKDITLGKIREYFTPRAIVLFEKDGFIKIS